MKFWIATLLAVTLGYSSPAAAAGNVVISQIYGGGGNTGSFYRNDFVELFNRSSVPVSLSGGSLQYASTSGVFFQSVLLSGVIPAGGYYLVRLGGGGGGSANLPFADAFGSINIEANSGVVALVNGTSFLSSCSSPNIVDLVGYGSSFICREGLSAPTLSNTTAAFRKGGGCQDTDFNSLDFATGPPDPFNSASPLKPCSGPPACTYSVSSTSASGPASGGTGTVSVTAAAGCNWTAVSNAAFVAITAGGSGSGNGVVSYSVAQNSSASQRIGTLTVAGYTVTITQAGATGDTAPPFGTVDTPLNNAVGVNGSIAMTGWALDDSGVTAIRILRSPVVAEPAGQLVFVGNGVLVNGARPDVAAAHANLPNSSRAGWGYLLLTNMLPNQGNGVFSFHIYADDAAGRSTLLGSRTITCSNSTATTPFGAIDTPGQGETVSGVVNNFGWVLSPGTRRADPPSGGVVTVFVDGAPVGAPGGWTSRGDLTALFPALQYSGVGSALGVFALNTATLTNGVHTIAWGVTDNQGGAAGIGSRYFTVQNATSVSASYLSSPVEVASRTAAAAESSLPQGRRGLDLSAQFEELHRDEQGTFILAAEELDRLELRIGAIDGRLKTRNGNQPLPIGSRLNRADGTFTWQPGPGFIGSYDLAFSTAGGEQTVRVTLYPKGTFSQPQVVIDAPSAQVTGSVTLSGWAVDPDLVSGIDVVHVWAHPLSGGLPVFLGAARPNLERRDVASIYGEAALRSGFELEVTSLAPGTYDLAVFAWRNSAGAFLPARTVRVTVR